MARLILIRHAECIANRDRLALGRADSPLTERGRRQAQALGEALAADRIDRILSSPLRRACDTAAPLAQRRALPVDAVDALTEMDIGELEGLTWPQARERFAAFLDEWRGPQAALVRMPGGESLGEVQARAWEVIAPLLTADDDRTAVVVSHNFVLRALICRALDLDLGHFRRFELDLTARSVLVHRGGLNVLLALNDLSHLRADATDDRA